MLNTGHLEVDFDDNVNHLGVGTYGSVHVGRYYGELAAVKRVLLGTLSPHMANDPFVKAKRSDALEDFAKQIQNQEKLVHPGVVKILGVSVSSHDSVLIVTELMQGGSMGAALRQLRKLHRPLDLGSFVRISLQVAGGLRAVHAAGYTWGEVKPENVLLSAKLNTAGCFPPSAQARISDFGLASSGIQTILTETTISSTGQSMGTVNYMAPESALTTGNETSATDVFSFGMVMYEMLTLRRPWKKIPLIEVGLRLARGARPEWPKDGEKDFYGHIPETLKNLVEKCWSQAMDDRPTADVLCSLLQDLVGIAFQHGEGLQRVGEREGSTLQTVSQDDEKEASAHSIHERADETNGKAYVSDELITPLNIDWPDREDTVFENDSEVIMKRKRTTDSSEETLRGQQKNASDPEARDRQASDFEQNAMHSIVGAHTVGDISSILQTMREHNSSLLVTRVGMAHILGHCKDELTYFDICEEGGIEVLMSGVVRFGEFDKELCVIFCDSMTILSEHYNDKVGHRIRATGVPTEVVELMNRHKIDVPVQTSGCKCLAAIAGGSELSRSAVATLGGPAAVYSAMTKNNVSFKNIELARASLNAVRQIAQGNERASEFLVQVSALDAVSRSAAVFTDHSLEGDILSALRAFSFYTGGRRNIVMSSGLKALAEIMLRNDDPEFLVLCCQFIRAIAQWRNVECEEAMLQSCIAERVTTLMQNSNYWPGEPGAKVSWYACQACLFLASFGSLSRKRLRQVGAIETTISILNQRRDNARVARCATDALAELLKGEPEGKIYAERSHAVEALKATLDLHGNDVKVRSAVQWTLDCLSSTQGPISAPAQDSQMHEELTDFASGSSKPKGRFLGFNFKRRFRAASKNVE